MAAKTKAAPPAGTVAARHALEAERQAAARAERNRIADQTLAAQKATAKFLASKPTDTRGLDRT